MLRKQMTVIDGKVVYVDIPGEEPEEERKARIAAEIQSLKEELAAYDYIGVKIAMGVATKEDYAKEIAHTETLRQRIRELEKPINE